MKLLAERESEVVNRLLDESGIGKEIEEMSEGKSKWHPSGAEK